MSRLSGGKKKKSKMRSWRLDVAKRRDREWTTFREFKSCKSKLIHYNYLEALQHAISVARKDKKFKAMHIYPCEFCDGIHIGRSATSEARMARGLRKRLKDIYRITCNPGFKEKASEDVQLKFKTIEENLNRELDQVELERQWFKNADLEGNALKKAALHGASAVQSQP